MKTWREQIKGLSREALAKKFKGMPVPTTEKFLREWVWWWRELPTLAANGWKLEGIPRSKIHLPAYWHPNTLAWLAFTAGAGGIEEWLYKQERLEFSARVKGDGVPELASPTIHTQDGERVQSLKKFTVPPMTFDSADSQKDVVAAVLAELRAQGWSGKTESVYRRDPRTAGPQGWADIFSVIEAIDRALLLGKQLTDSERRAIAARLNREF